MTASPRLTVRAFAEVLELPMHGMSRLLRDQKHPKEEPALFRLPYYDPTRMAIRRYFAGGNNPAVLTLATQSIVAQANPKDRSDRAGNNVRVIGAFGRSPFATRVLAPSRKMAWSAEKSGLELRTAFDLIAEEKGETRYFFFNCGSSPVAPSLARATVEAAHWVLEENGEPVAMRQFQYLDLANGAAHVFKSRTKVF
jgi:hypothetical protein